MRGQSQGIGGVLVGIGTSALAEHLGFHNISMVAVAMAVSGCVLVGVGLIEIWSRKHS